MTGMSPDAVLDEDQKKIRFRKLLSKRQRMEADSPKTGEECADGRDNSDQEDEDIDVVNLSNHSSHPEKGRESIGFSEQKSFQYSEYQIPIAAQQPAFLRYNTEPVQDPIVQQSSEENEIAGKCSSKLKSIVRSYQIALSQTKCWKSESIFSMLNAIQRGETGISVSKRDVLFLISKMSEVFRHFALLQR